LCIYCAKVASFPNGTSFQKDRNTIGLFLFSVKALQQNLKPKPFNVDCFFILIDKKYQRISFDDIIYIEAKKRYVHLVTEKEKFLLPIPLKRLEAYLPPTQFFKLQRYIISEKKITRFDREFVYLDNHQLKLNSRSFLKLRQHLNVVEVEGKIVYQLQEILSLLSIESSSESKDIP